MRLSLGFLIAALLLGFSACQRQNKPIQTQAPAPSLAKSAMQQQYFLDALHNAGYAQNIVLAGTDVVNSQLWKPVDVMQMPMLVDYYTYFGTPLRMQHSALDSMAAIAHLVYQSSNYGWMPAAISNSEFTSLNSMGQYYAMQNNNFNGRCSALSDFLMKTFHQFGYPAAVIDFAVRDTNDSYKHTAVIVSVAQKWYIVESTTGQMLMLSDGGYIDYDAYLGIVKARRANYLKLTPATYGKFIQPSPYYGQIEWLYGDTDDTVILLKNTDAFALLYTKRDIAAWQKEPTVIGTYLHALDDMYGEPNWLYIYDTANIETIRGDEKVAEIFKQRYGI